MLMKYNLPYLVNLPPFLLKDIDERNLSSVKKIRLIIGGKLISILIKRTKGKVFCAILNIFFANDGKIYFDGDKYYKESENFQKIYFPNKRILRVVKNTKKHLDLVFQYYCLDSIELKNGDLIIDCGANVGEVYLSMLSNNIKCKYIAFEPDKITFNSLEKNILSESKELNQIALSNTVEQKSLFLDSEGGNSSLISFGTDEHVKVDTNTLDNYEINESIKLLKIEAEGHEPEVLLGSLKTLKKVNYISVDFGAERGVDQDYTIVEVNNILYDNDFKLVNFSDYRFIGLYKNTKIND